MTVSSLRVEGLESEGLELQPSHRHLCLRRIISSPVAASVTNVKPTSRPLDYAVLRGTVFAGMYEQLCASKTVITEPSNVSGEVFDDAIKSYRQEIDQMNATSCTHTHTHGCNLALSSGCPLWILM